MSQKAGPSECHLILGASAGIGFAYAQRLASSGAVVKMVGRSVSALKRAQEALVAGGAAGVDFHPGDILDGGFRRALFEHYSCAAFASVFVGGPSPPAGRFREVLPGDYLTASRIVLDYPVSTLEWALGSPVSVGGSVILLSSSASGESLRDHPFFLSALLRRALDEVVDAYLDEFTRASKMLVVWRPKVVLTSLATLYAASHADRETAEYLRKALRRKLGVEPVTPEEFVRQMLYKE